MELSVKTEFKNGKFVLNPGKVQEALRQFDGQEIELTVKKWKDNRTNRQNRTLHGWCKIIGDFTGDDTHKIKEILKWKFLREEILDDDGFYTLDEKNNIIEIARSTSGLNIEEFAEFLTKISIWTAEFLNITLPVNEEC